MTQARTHSYVLQCQRLEKREQLFVDFLQYIKKSEKKRRIGSPEKEKCVGGIRREGENTDSFKKVFLSEGRSEHACARCNAGSLTELISVKFTKLRVLRTE